MINHFSTIVNIIIFPFSA